MTCGIGVLDGQGKVCLGWRTQQFALHARASRARPSVGKGPTNTGMLNSSPGGGSSARSHPGAT